MIKEFKKNIFNLNHGDKRSIKARKNILSLLGVKLVSVPISFVMVPLTLGYVNEESYGIWLTLSSIVAWINFFDIGINNGLRNKLAESLAKGDFDLSKKYLSTTYALLSIFSISIFLIFLICNLFVDWSVVLNTNPLMANELSKVSIIVVGYVCIRFVLSTVNIVLLSSQLPAKASLISLFEQTASLIAVFMLTKFTEGSLLKLAFGLCVIPIAVLIYFNLSLFVGKLKYLKPSFSNIQMSLTKDLMGLGIKFFIIQIAGIIQFQTANFIIIQYFGANDVTIYNIAFKYFSILTMVMAVFMTPLWSAVTEAYAINDYSWIKQTENKYRILAIVLAIAAIIMLAFSRVAYDIWLGNNKIQVPFIVSAGMMIYTVISFFGGIYCAILNGISALNIQFKASLFSPFIFLLLSYLFIKQFNMGLVSVIFASIIANFNAYILAPIQYFYIFRNKKTMSEC